MLADLIGRQVAMIVTSGIDPSKIAKAATTTLPIVFITDVDPVEIGNDIEEEKERQETSRQS